MTSPEGADPDMAIMREIRELAGRLSNERTQAVVTSLLDAVALNPQPLPPKPPPEDLRIQAIFQLVADAVALHPQPLPPKVHVGVDLGPAG